MVCFGNKLPKHQNVDGWTDIDFAVAVLWHGIPPDSVHILATNSSDPHLPPGCDVMSGFYTYRLKDRLSDKYLKLCDLFGLTPVDCMDFYMRGSGLTYQGDDISPVKLIVSDGCNTNSQENEWELNDWPILYMSHDDQMLDEEFRDDYSSSLACLIDYDVTDALQYGSRRGRYDLNGDMLNVFNDLKLGGTGKLTLWNPDCHTEISVQSGADLFVSVAHGNKGHRNGIMKPWVKGFSRRDNTGVIGDCIPIENDDNQPAYWDSRFSPEDWDNFSATNWLALCSCLQLNDGVGWSDYYNELIDTQPPLLLAIGGYGSETGIDQTTLGRGWLQITTAIAPYFNAVMAGTQEPDDSLWETFPAFDKFVCAWMESHCDYARENEGKDFHTRSTRALDSDFKYYLKKSKGYYSFGWQKYYEPEWQISRQLIF